MIHVQSFFFTIEYVNNNTNKHVEYKQGTGNHIDHEEHNLKWISVFDLNFINFSAIYSIPHDSNPSFGCHDVEQGYQTLTNVIKVLVLVYPISSVIHTVKSVVNDRSIWFWDVVSVAAIEFSFVEVGSKNCKQQDEK
jgi:hypothetical protein